MGVGFSDKSEGLRFKRPNFVRNYDKSPSGSLGRSPSCPSAQKGVVPIISANRSVLSDSAVKICAGVTAEKSQATKMPGSGTGGKDDHRIAVVPAEGDRPSVCGAQ